MESKYKYSGVLELYFETGMEGYGLILADERGFTTGPSFSNETKQYDGPPMQYRSLEWSYWFSKKPCYINVYDSNGGTLYSGPITYNRKAVAKHKYRFSHFPNELDPKTWLGFFEKEYKAEVFTTDPALAEDAEYKKAKK